MRQCVFSGLFELPRENSSLRQFTVNNRWAQMIYSFSSPRFCPALSLPVLPLGSENKGNLAKPPPCEEELQPWHYFYYLSVVAADSPQVKGSRQTGWCCVIVTDPSSWIAGVAAETGVFENKRAWLHLCKRRRRLQRLAATDATRKRGFWRESPAERADSARARAGGRKVTKERWLPPQTHTSFVLPKQETPQRSKLESEYSACYLCRFFYWFKAVWCLKGRQEAGKALLGEMLVYMWMECIAKINSASEQRCDFHPLKSSH